MSIYEISDNYLNCLACYKNDKWTDLLVEVDFDGPDHTSAPLILLAIGGTKSSTKLQLANLSLIDWMAATKKKNMKPLKQNNNKLKQGGVPYYQPSTQNQRLRTFFGTVTRIFDWQYDLVDFNFNRGLNEFLKDLYKKREQEFGKVMISLCLFFLFYLTNIT